MSGMSGYSLMISTTQIRAIESFVEGLSQEDFKKDRKTFSATIRELEIIGEAVNNISDELKQKYLHVLWQESDPFGIRLSMNISELISESYGTS